LTTMPLAPAGTRWFAKPDHDGWMVLYLGPANWTDEQIQLPNFGANDLLVWPNSLPGLCGNRTDRVVSMAHSLIARFRERFPAIAQGIDVAAAINDGGPLPAMDAPEPAQVTPEPSCPQFAPGTRVRLGTIGAIRTVISQVGRVVVAEDGKGKRRRCDPYALHIAHL